MRTRPPKSRKNAGDDFMVRQKTLAKARNSVNQLSCGVPIHGMTAPLGCRILVPKAQKCFERFASVTCHSAVRNTRRSLQKLRRRMKIVGNSNPCFSALPTSRWKIELPFGLQDVLPAGGWEHISGGPENADLKSRNRCMPASRLPAAGAVRPFTSSRDHRSIPRPNRTPTTVQTPNTPSRGDRRRNKPTGVPLSPPSADLYHAHPVHAQSPAGSEPAFELLAVPRVPGQILDPAPELPPWFRGERVQEILHRLPHNDASPHRDMAASRASAS